MRFCTRSFILLSLFASPNLAGCHRSPVVGAAAAPVATLEATASPVSPPVPLVSDRELSGGVRWRQYAGSSPRWKKPLFINVLEFDPRDPALDVQVIAASAPTRSHRESTRKIARRLHALAAINGSYFNFVARRSNGDPIGLVVSHGHLLNPATGERPALGIMPDGRIFFGRPSRHDDGEASAQLARWTPLPAATASVSPRAAVLALWNRLFGRRVAQGEGEARLEPNDSDLGAPWNQAAYALEGGPTLIHEGAAVPLQGFNYSILHGREPRTAVALTREGHMLWLTVDGRVPGHSMGTNLNEITQLFLSLGATEALNWDGGGSTTMVIEGRPVTKIATGWVREVANALVLVSAATGDPAI